MKPGIGDLMKQAQKLQEQMQKTQNELANLQVCGESGGRIGEGDHDRAPRRESGSRSTLRCCRKKKECWRICWLPRDSMIDAVRVEGQPRRKISSLSAGLNSSRRLQDAVLRQTDSTPMSELINQLASALRCLPGVGQKSSQRMVMHLLERNRAGRLRLAEALIRAASMRWATARAACNFTEQPLCAVVPIPGAIRACSASSKPRPTCWRSNSRAVIAGSISC